MRFVYFPESAFPRLAWLCEMRTGRDEARVHHGPWVETHEGAFVEGAWAGPFGEDGFADSFLAGTGARTDGDGVLFAAPDHTLDRLFHARRGDRFVVSNSCAALLSFLGEGLREDFLDYNALLASPYLGVRAYARALPGAGGEIGMQAFNNFRVDRALGFAETEKRRACDFHDFTSYMDFLKSQVGALFANAADPARRVRYAPLSMISSGYDSTMATVLAASQGCREAATFGRARGRPGAAGAAGADDSGADNARRLGMTAHVVDRLAYRAFSDMPEIDTQGSPCELASLREMLPGRVLLTGFGGDGLWDRAPDYVGPDIVRAGAGGTNWTEARLHWGFIHFPPAFLGIREHARIHAIACAAEMEPWSLGNDYDRPICRRAIEEAGIPREAFGMSKRAAGVYATKEGLANVMSPAALRDFRAYAAQRWRGWRRVSGALNHLWFTLARLNAGLRRRLRRGALAGLRIPVPILFRPTPLRTELSLLIGWSMDRLIARYRFADGDAAAPCKDVAARRKAASDESSSIARGRAAAPGAAEETGAR